MTASEGRQGGSADHFALPLASASEKPRVGVMSAARNGDVSLSHGTRAARRQGLRPHNETRTKVWSPITATVGDPAQAGGVRTTL